jgi:acyl-CoA synthetase (NDP forming)/GNAT superfamily N-acetyltransferase
MSSGDAGSGVSDPSFNPSRWAFGALLTDGDPVLVRPLAPSDARALVPFASKLSPAMMRTLDVGALPDVGMQRTTPAGVDGRSRMAFVAIVADEPVAVVGYRRVDPGEPVAEIALVVADTFRHHGVGTLLLETLVAYAKTEAIVHFVTELGIEDAATLEVLESSGLGCTRVRVDDTVRLDIDLRSTGEYYARCDERESTAEAASVASILCPRSIAVVGAGRQLDNVGHQVVRSLLAGDFSGTVYPVNPTARAICGVPAFPTLSSLPEQIDLAIIAVPSAAVPGVVNEAASNGVRAVTIISSGFGETGRSGAEVEVELLQLARRKGMRIVGPNCLGVVNTDPNFRVNATFAALDPPPGRLALVSQSGAVGIVLAEEARQAGLGLSTFVSVGNTLDVSANDLLCSFEHDDRTAVIALYLESVGNPRKFARIARRVGGSKPIVALKAGRTVAGARGARSHTAAAATPQVVITALLQSAGVIKVDRLEELFDVSALLVAAPLPASNRIGLVGNSGGPLILAADGCEAGGLRVPELAGPTRKALRGVLGTSAAVGNPVDITADGDAHSLAQAMEIVLHDDGIDAVMVVVTNLVALSATGAREVVARIAKWSDKPIVVCILGAQSEAATTDALAVAELPTPERAATALARVCSYAHWRRHPPTPSVTGWRIPNPAVAHDIVTSTLGGSNLGGWLPPDQAARLMEACGIPVVPTLPATTAAEAASVAESVGFPVALKARSGDIVHKSDVGGVVVGLDSPDAVRRAYEAMHDRIGDQMGGGVVQPMAPAGIEAIVGLASDPDSGPVVMVGLGGVMVDLLGDRAFGVPPFDVGTAEAMIGKLRAAPLLDGFRGSPTVDRQALVSVLEAVAHIAEEIPELVELDLNPVIVSPDGALIADCKVRVSPSPSGPGPLFRSLRSSQDG